MISIAKKETDLCVTPSAEYEEGWVKQILLLNYSTGKQLPICRRVGLFFPKATKVGEAANSSHTLKYTQQLQEFMSDSSKDF